VEGRKLEGTRFDMNGQAVTGQGGWHVDETMGIRSSSG
jgi:hypothetical protein